MVSALEQEELLEALPGDFDWSLLLPLIIRKRLNDDVGIVPAEVMNEYWGFYLVTELEGAGGVRGTSEPAGDVTVVANPLAARSFVEIFVADVALLRIIEPINIDRSHLHPLLSRQELDQLRLNLLKGIEKFFSRIIRMQNLDIVKFLCIWHATAKDDLVRETGGPVFLI